MPLINPLMPVPHLMSDELEIVNLRRLFRLTCSLFRTSAAEKKKIAFKNSVVYIINNIGYDFDSTAV